MNDIEAKELEHDSILVPAPEWRPSEVRSAMLVVVALMVTITFQAGINPPSTYFDSGKAPGDYVSDFLFLFGNTMGFSTSATMLEKLTEDFPYHRELKLSIIAMSFTYGTTLTLNIRNSEAAHPKLTAIAYIVFLVALLLPYSINRHWRRKPAPAPATTRLAV